METAHLEFRGALLGWEPPKDTDGVICPRYPSRPSKAPHTAPGALPVCWSSMSWAPHFCGRQITTRASPCPAIHFLPYTFPLHFFPLQETLRNFFHRFSSPFLRNEGSNSCLPLFCSSTAEDELTCWEPPQPPCKSRSPLSQLCFQAKLGWVSNKPGPGFNWAWAKS